MLNWAYTQVIPTCQKLDMLPFPLKGQNSLACNMQVELALDTSTSKFNILNAILVSYEKLATKKWYNNDSEMPRTYDWVPGASRPLIRWICLVSN